MKVFPFGPMPDVVLESLASLARGGTVLVVDDPAVADAVLAAAASIDALPDSVAGATGRGPVILAWGSGDDAARALASGADHWLGSPEGEPAFARILAAQLQAVSRRLQPRADVRPRALPDLLQHEFDRAARYRRALAVLVAATPSPGTEGDVLARCRAAVRDVDTVAELPSGRIAVVLPETDAGGALAAALRVHAALAPGSHVGVAAYPARGIEGSDDLLGRALEALLQARRGGSDVISFGAPGVIWARQAPDPASVPDA